MKLTAVKPSSEWILQFSPLAGVLQSGEVSKSQTWRERQKEREPTSVPTDQAAPVVSQPATSDPDWDLKLPNLLTV